MRYRALASSVLLLLGASLTAAAAPPVGNSTAGREAAYLRANDEAMRKMMVDMDVAPSGDVDRDFARMMIPHHQGGIDMARALLRYGKDERMKTLGREIIAKQEQEIALMRRMIGGSPAPVARRSGGGMPRMHMSGAGLSGGPPHARAR